MSKQAGNKKDKVAFHEEQADTSNEDKYQKVVKERDQYKDKYYRLAAEFENARKRMDREQNEFIKYANEKLVVEFLNILDDLERSLQVAEEKYKDDEAYLKGLKMVVDEIHAMLKRNGVKPMEAEGRPFDPNYHEVLMQEESDQVKENTVFQELQKGYLLGDKVIRTAKVKIGCPKEVKSEESKPVKHKKINIEES